MNNNNIYRKAKTWQLIMAPASACIPTLFIIMMTFASYVANGVYGMATVLAGTIITGTRVFDAITDPLVALVCDRYEGKFGRARLFSTVGWVIMCFTIIAMFNLGIGGGKGTGSAAAFIVIYLIYIIGYTIFGIGSQLVQPIMTNDPKQRPIMSRWQTVYTTVLSSTIAIILAKLLMPRHNFQLGLPLFKDLSLFVIISTGVLLAITNITVTLAKVDVPESYAGTDKSKVSMKDVFEMIAHSRPLQMYIIAAGSDKLALQTASNSAITVMIFGIILGDYGFSGSLTFINLIVTLIILMFFVTKFAGNAGLKKATVMWTRIGVAMYALMWIYLLVTPTLKITKTPVLKIIFIILFCAMGGAKMAISAVSTPMRYDIIDYEFSRTGKYMPATVSATYSFVDKLISSLATTIVALCVATIGYKNSMPQATDKLTGSLFAVGTFLWLGVPIIGYLCTLISMHWYKLDKETMEEVEKKNAEARAKQKAQA